MGLLTWLNSNKEWVFSGIGASATTLILERIRLAIKQDKSHQKLPSDSESSSSGYRVVRMNSWNEIYKHAIELIELSKSRIRATSFSTSNFQYIETIAIKASEQKRRKNDFLYKVVLADTGVSDQLYKNIKERKKIFRKYNSEDRLLIKSRREVWGIDFLIIDDQHMHLSFQRVSGSSLVVGLEFRDTPNIVRDIAQWYDEYLFEPSDNIDNYEIS